MTPYFVITPGELVNFTVPALEIVAGYDTVPSSKYKLNDISSITIITQLTWITDVTGYACAPEDLTGKRFYDAMRGPTWYVNATAYGHGDFLDPTFEYIIEVCTIHKSLLDFLNHASFRNTGYAILRDQSGNSQRRVHLLYSRTDSCLYKSCAQSCCKL